ncbi:MAG: N-formylglutamate amidohydrolase [Sphingopyxis sp.]|nr:N-formylglutamate amidohydrolase [Sphingopyxis sp.]
MPGPQRGVHAIQVEFDRALYLDATMQPEADRALALGEWLLAAACRALNSLIVGNDWPQAAE